METVVKIELRKIRNSEEGYKARKVIIMERKPKQKHLDFMTKIPTS